MSAALHFFATCAKGMEPLLAGELRALHAHGVRETRAGVAFSGPMEAGYRACLWSRLASRILLPVGRFYAATPQALYDGVRQVLWREHLAEDGTLAVDFSAAQSAITHSHFGALKVKDAIVDQFREACGTRPGVDTARPDLRVNVYLYRDEATVAIDLSGDALHRRGYRGEQGEAPLKENLAAAILGYARWPNIAAQGGALVDLMCGSGTLLVEGALMAADIAPGLLRAHFGFSRWGGHDAALWEKLRAEARDRQSAGLAHLPPIHGYDRDPRAVRSANENIRRAGLHGLIHVERRELAATEPVPGVPGLVVANPPYGERMGVDAGLEDLYATLGQAIKQNFPGWRAAIFTGNPDLAHFMRLAASRKNTLYNGPIECKLLHYEISG